MVKSKTTQYGGTDPVHAPAAPTAAPAPAAHAPTVTAPAASAPAAPAHTTDIIDTILKAPATIASAITSTAAPESAPSNIFAPTNKPVNVVAHKSAGITFQKIVAYIAAIILAGTLVIIGVMIYNSNASTEYPPDTSECPDYWENIGPNKCRNTLKLGKCKDNEEMDFSDPKYSGPQGKVEKCKWANNCGLVWDGLC